ncbi:uncharacterized protein BT62DRAFT_748049 [Guyanagaster necrorhizus]|uniref:Uncharacterized protein n=1 Tax=Guyanagaster necrorhizus TaxID=856835 RepID=A0A9P8AU11_9AGAR|nr:uncharacterized protein BT62DRAFT_748049 [Guyanagaster necrorhizus MCA 3950]KAG7447993.1 hypothetical protein BT62DRAFT_748049 [Guyanagaster necrorhizus MCA 3950]
MICPFCVLDCSLPVGERMGQWISHDLFVPHLVLHIDDIDDGKFCPVPSCGSTVFSKYGI